jgi:hypothetical protein
MTPARPANRNSQEIEGPNRGTLVSWGPRRRGELPPCSVLPSAKNRSGLTRRSFQGASAVWATPAGLAWCQAACRDAWLAEVEPPHALTARILCPKRLRVLDDGPEGGKPRPVTVAPSVRW